MLKKVRSEKFGTPPAFDSAKDIHFSEWPAKCEIKPVVAESGLCRVLVLLNFCTRRNFQNVQVEFESFGYNKFQLTISAALPSLNPIKHGNLFEFEHLIHIFLLSPFVFD